MLRLHEYRYHRPTDLLAALTLKQEFATNSVLIAGGTDLVPNMKHQLFTPDHIIALKGVPELHGIRLAGQYLSIGAAETLAAVSRHPLVLEFAPSLARAAGLVAGPQIRNAGTIGGNLCLDTRCTYYNQTYFWRSALGFCLKKDGDVCHVTKVGKKCVAAHSADTAPVLMTLNAIADLASPSGERSVPISDWFVADGIWNSVRRPDEIVTRIRIPLPKPGTRAAFRKLRQRGSIDFPLLNVAAVAELQPDQTITALRMVVSALGSRPRTLSGLDRIIGEKLTPDVIDTVADRAFQQCHPLENIIVDSEWRRAMVRVYVKRTLTDMI